MLNDVNILILYIVPEGSLIITQENLTGYFPISYGMQLMLIILLFSKAMQAHIEKLTEINKEKDIKISKVL